MTVLDTYYPFDTGAGATATVPRWRAMARRFYGTGIVAGYANQFNATLAGSVLTIQTGALWADGFYGEVTIPKTLTITGNGMVVARMDPVARTIAFFYVVGQSTPTQNPNGIFEIPLYQITGATVTDIRQFGVGDPNTIPRGYITRAIGPAAAHDVEDANTVMCSMTVPVIQSRYYAITAYGQGSQITAAGVPNQFWVTDDQSHSWNIMYATSFPVNYIFSGSGRLLYGAAATRNTVFTMYARSGGSGALRIAVNLCNMFIEDVGT